MKALPLALLLGLYLSISGCPGDEAVCMTDAECADLPCPNGEQGVCSAAEVCVCDGNSGTGGTGATDGGMPDGGTGATDGGMPSDCGSAVGSDVPDLASDVQVFLNGEDVTNNEPPAVVVNGDTVRVEFLTTQGTSFVNVFLVNGADSIGNNGAEVTGGQMASIEVTVVQQIGMETVFAVNVIADNGTQVDPPTMASLYAVSDVPACNSVVRIFDDNGTFGDEEPTLCTATCLGYEDE